MKKKITLFELLGLIFILLSFFLQVFLADSSQELTNNGIRYKIEQKIDIIYNMTRDNYQKLHPEIEKPHFMANPAAFDLYQYATEDNLIKFPKAQTKSFNFVAITFFIIGSICLIIAKMYEYRKNQSQ